MHCPDSRLKVILIFAAALMLLAFFCLINTDTKSLAGPEGSYTALPADTDTGDPLEYLGKNFGVKKGFYTNLPIVIISTDDELPDYKLYRNGQEIISEDINPYTEGEIRIIDDGQGHNTVNGESVYESRIKIKKKGHSSYGYDKAQYKFKSLLADGDDNDADILGMGEGSEWVLNGSMADKSMLRNYLAYRIASEIGGNDMAPDCRYCELMTEKNGKLKYEGVYLLCETVSRGEDRVLIDKYDEKERYSSYIVRRDRKTVFDIMLDTYGRRAEIDKNSATWETDNWIGLKYPPASRVTDEAVHFIENDFSTVEKVIYSDNIPLFKQYNKFIDVNSFVDYYLINEFFGNYDAGLHSTYMYKNAGDPLSIGPVWDFDQAMDNNFLEEMDAGSMAMQTATFFKQLCNDKSFVRRLQDRYNFLRRNHLSEDHVFDIIDETSAYIRSAQEREWYRWAADYMDDSDDNPHNYHLKPYRENNVMLGRFTDDYDQELIVIENYLHKHGTAIPVELSALYRKADINSAAGGLRELIFAAAMMLLLLPSYLINRRG